MSDAGLLILVIEDDIQIRRFLKTALTANGYHLLEAASGLEGISLAATQHPDLIILDMGLPDMDGLEVTQRLREWSTIPIIILSVREKERDKVAVLDAGADDYLTKPFGIPELLARMRVALRHALRTAQGIEEPIFTTGDLKVDMGRRQVFVKENEVHLTPLEYKLLTTLVKHAGKVVTRDHLLKEVWGPHFTDQMHYLRVYMAQLRHKLEEDPALPRHLITEPGVGYRLKVE